MIPLQLEFLQTGELYCRLDIGVLFFGALDFLPEASDYGPDGGISMFCYPFSVDAIGSSCLDLTRFVLNRFLKTFVLSLEDS